MQYFSNFPKTLFLVKPAGYKQPAEYVSLTDITRNVRFKKEVIDNITLYDTYNIKEGDTPELISEKLYNTPYYHWVIMLLNDRYDYINDFPMSQATFDRYIEQKYSASYMESVYGTGPEGLIVDIVKDNASVDVEGIFALVNRQTPTQVVYRNIMSVWAYDDTLGIKVKRFLYTDQETDGSYRVNLLQWRIDFGAVPDVKVVTALNKEIEDNAKKAKIKVVTKDFLDLIMTNFKELM
jgi:hypothetical protein